MVSSSPVVAFLAVTDASRAREFYESKLSLTFVRDDEFALIFNLNGATLRVVRTDPKTFKPQPFTVLGWEVDNIAAAVRELKKKGVQFMRYDFLEQDGDDVWTAPGGAAKVAWLRDPDGNVLSLSSGGV